MTPKELLAQLRSILSQPPPIVPTPAGSFQVGSSRALAEHMLYQIANLHNRAAAEENEMSPLQEVHLLLTRKLLRPYTGGPMPQGATLFFEQIEGDLLLQREAALQNGADFWLWILLSDVALSSEWLDELRGTYQVSVVFVENVAAARRWLGV